MAANKRIPIKWIRDKAKAAYEKADECFICGSSEELELHHTHGLTNLLMKWAKANKVDISTDEAVKEIREQFIDEHRKEIYDDVFTLCASHHTKLHGVYGKSPALSTAPKQVVWIQKQKGLLNGEQYVEQAPKRSFGQPSVEGEAKPSSGVDLPRRGFSSWY